MKRQNTTTQKAPPQQADDPEAWVNLYGDHLYAYALFRTGDRQIAEDLVQDTFLAGLAGLEGFQGRATVKTWLTGILKNKIRDHYRRQTRNRIHPKPVEDLSLDEIFDARGKWKLKPSPWSRDPHKDVEAKELMDFIRRCIASLAEKLADIFVLREIDGWNSAEICKVFGITPSNLWVRLHRARVQMRDCLTKSWGDPGLVGKEKRP